MMESLTSSDLTPIFIVLIVGVGAFLFGMYYTRELREPPPKADVPAKKKRRAVATR
jgi:hypothetical protein